MAKATLTEEQEHRMKLFLELYEDFKAMEEELTSLKETIKLDIIAGVNYENDRARLILTDPINTIYYPEKLAEKVGKDLVIEVSKIQIAFLNEKIQKGAVRKEDLEGTYHTERGTPSLRVQWKKGK